jgi:inosine-uridine nucleoside N-ribohydrolase
MSGHKVILDVDTGTDDAIAIMIAALHPAIDLVGCTTVSGNIEVEICTDNTLRVLDHIGRSDIPVFEGAKRPFVREDQPFPRKDNRLLQQLHGKTLPLDAPRRPKESKSAVEFIIEIFKAATDPIILVATAPLTNLAAALSVEPRLIDWIGDLRIMGGGHDTGNITAAAEFNIWADPEAAARVLGAGFRNLTFVPLDATHKALVSQSDCAALDALGTPAGEAAAMLLSRRIVAQDKAQVLDQGGTTAVHDALCLITVIDPAVVTTRLLHVAVETQGTLTVGRTVMDMRSGSQPNCKVAFDVDQPLFHRLMRDALSRRAPIDSA